LDQGFRIPRSEKAVASYRLPVHGVPVQVFKDRGGPWPGILDARTMLAQNFLQCDEVIPLSGAEWQNRHD
jgi:hypothetical protein